MTINFSIKDRNGVEIEIGDKVEIFDWDKSKRSLGFCVICFDPTEGRITSDPVLVEDPYDLITKCLPRSVVIEKGKKVEDKEEIETLRYRVCEHIHKHIACSVCVSLDDTETSAISRNTLDLVVVGEVS